MTSYERGFLTKCAECGLPAGTAIGLLKKATPAGMWDVVGRSWRPIAGSLARGAGHVVGGLGDDVTAAALRRYASRQPTARKLFGEFMGDTNFGRMLSGKNVEDVSKRFSGGPWAPYSEADKAELKRLYEQAVNSGDRVNAAIYEHALSEGTGARYWAGERIEPWLAGSGRTVGLVPTMRSLGKAQTETKAALEAARTAGNAEEVARLTDKLSRIEHGIERTAYRMQDPEAYMHGYLDTIGRRTRVNVEKALSKAVDDGDTAMANKLKDVLAGKASLNDVGGVKGVMSDSQAGLDYIREARKTRNARLGTAGAAMAVPTAAYALSTGERRPNDAAYGGYGTYGDYFR